MTRQSKSAAAAFVLLSFLTGSPWLCLPVYSQAQKPILDTKTNLSSVRLSPAAHQLGDQLGINEKIKNLETLRLKSEMTDLKPLTRVVIRQDFVVNRQDILEQIEQTRLEVDFTLARINEEMSLYTELIEAYADERNKKVAHTNLLAFASNGIMWAIAEALTIPTFRVPSLSVSSGVVGILAGATPSVFSALAVKLIEGKKHRPHELPNMLSKVFGYPTSQDTEYPDSVWTFLNTIPAGDKSGETRIEQIIQHWIGDHYIRSFTSRDSKQQLDSLIGSKESNYELTIGLLRDRRTMLQQLHAQVSKMNRLLLELLLVMRGEKLYLVENQNLEEEKEEDKRDQDAQIEQEKQGKPRMLDRITPLVPNLHLPTLDPSERAGDL